MRLKKPEKVLALNVDILKSENRTVVPVTGIFGGLNSQSQLIAHLYVEYADLPTEGKVAINIEEQKVVENSLAFRNSHITREILTTIVIPISLVPAFAQWFQDQAALAATAKPVDLK